MAKLKATPRLLGWGAARMAGEKLEGRNAQVQAALDEAMGESPRKKKGSVSDRLGVRKN